MYWRAYNIASSGGVSETYFKNQILAQLTSSEYPGYVFKSKYEELKEISNNYLGWQILLPLNEKYLNKYINDSNINDIKGSISKFEFILRKLDFEGHENHIQFLRKLQNLRSASSAHRKGSNYEKIAIEFDVENKDLKSIFEEILHKAIAFINYLIEIIKSEKLIKTS